MGLFKTFGVIGVTALSVSLTACQKQEANTSSQNTNTVNDEVKTLTLGFQKSAANFLVARQQKILEQEFPQTKIEWKDFPAGPQLLEALSVGAVDVGVVGNTPPIFAQAAGKELTYVGYEVQPTVNQAILIHKDSSIKNIQDLKGKRIALQKGSNMHEFLANVLNKAGLKWSDIEPIWLPPADAGAAFNKKSVDAWAIWEPNLTTAIETTQAKTLIDGQVFPKTYLYYVAHPTFAQAHPDAIKKVIKSLNQADEWIIKNPDEALKTYMASTGLDKKIAQIVLNKRLKPSLVYPINEEVIKSQQKIADLFYSEKLLPKQINIQDAVLNSTQ
ncbi:aliphatic sulfonate ABC transporter substrate-binding protein [Acinetobacter portensis]|uniref:aliphatic sulfonate ABC transporter substrate-binding protein n=1 Tax=Acinetobacter portensis TaxID=1839785 RepID=UPI0013D37A11|nr:aliphatic sulfonate ABC transporter substrate-binding protein [Acinetobacter portensis]